MILAALPAKAAAIGKKIAPYAIVAVVIGLVLLLAYCQGREDGKTGAIVAEQERTIEVQASESTAAEAAASERVADEVGLAKQNQELIDASKHSESDDARRIRRGCLILQQQGRDTSKFPACR